MSTPNVVINSDSNSQKTKRKYNFKSKSDNKQKIDKDVVINPKRKETIVTKDLEIRRNLLLSQVETLQKALDLIKILDSNE